MLLLRWIHIVALVVFAGGGLAAGLVNRLAFTETDARTLDVAQRDLGRFADAGALLAFVSGIGLVVAEDLGAGFGKAGWLQIMIACGLLAAAMNGIAGARLRRLIDDPPASADAQLARRTVVFRLRMVFLAAILGAIACGVWRFSW
jgi:uncharacterized membrane protein